MKKILSVILALALMSLAFPCSANAAALQESEQLWVASSNSPDMAASTTEYAYSIGHDFGIDIPLVNDHAGDCTISVTHASTVYGMLGYTSYYNYDPTYGYLRGENPAGTDRLGSSIVYIDGHANYDNIICGDTVDDSKHQCGVYYLTDFTSTSSGYTYAGLQDRDLSGVKLFTFVGCNTATNNVNLCTSAEDGGATCVVGFTDTINGLTTEGQNWKKAYNNALGNGETVSDAIAYATTLHPNCNLGDSAKTYGDASINIALNNSRASLITESDVRVIATEKIPFDFSYVVNGEYVPLEDVQKEYSGIIQFMNKRDSNFDLSQYKVLANGYYNDNGIIKVRYYLDDIETSSVIVFTVVDGMIVSYSDSHDNSIKDENERTDILKTCIAFEQKERKSANYVPEQVVEKYNVESNTGRYYYDFSDNTLYYITDVVYSLPGSNACGMTEVRTPIKVF
ncbi:MAG TPA: hypothetical protein DHU75_06735 [Rikenellaceae bacterium]|nr:hypothetical protein [Rikenellaceae bacterium]